MRGVGGEEALVLVRGGGGGVTWIDRSLPTLHDDVLLAAAELGEEASGIVCVCVRVCISPLGSRDPRAVEGDRGAKAAAAACKATGGGGDRATAGGIRGRGQEKTRGMAG
ncbi:hypothetical protein ACSSS7_006602 [Eimeria intestinalis]